jgi:hypothetical protein
MATNVTATNSAHDEARVLCQAQPQRWEAAWHARVAHHGRTVRFDRPVDTIPVSVTGAACALDCAHCNRVYLRHMRTLPEVAAPGALPAGASLLISGGCDAQGRVPLMPHLETLRDLAANHRLNLHVGLIGADEARALAPLAEVVSFDVVGDRAAAREVYGLDVGLDDYMRTLDALRQHVAVVPHVTIGLRGGQPSGERAALDALAAREIERLVYIVLIPTAGTRYVHCDPPPLAYVADLLLETRLRLPRTDLILGCMRPRGHYGRVLDLLALRAGVTALVNPSHLAVEEAAALGLEVSWGSACCALD